MTMIANGAKVNHRHQTGIGILAAPEVVKACGEWLRPPQAKALLAKLRAIDATLHAEDLTAQEALIMIGLVLRSDADFNNAFPSARTLAKYARYRKTDAVYKALGRLEREHGLVVGERRLGHTTRYQLLPQRLFDTVALAFRQKQVEYLGPSEVIDVAAATMDDTTIPPAIALKACEPPPPEGGGGGLAEGGGPPPIEGGGGTPPEGVGGYPAKGGTNRVHGIESLNRRVPARERAPPRRPRAGLRPLPEALELALRTMAQSRGFVPLGDAVQGLAMKEPGYG